MNPVLIDFDRLGKTGLRSLFRLSPLLLPSKALRTEAKEMKLFAGRIRPGRWQPSVGRNLVLLSEDSILLSVWEDIELGLMAITGFFWQNTWVKPVSS